MEHEESTEFLGVHIALNKIRHGKQVRKFRSPLSTEYLGQLSTKNVQDFVLFSRNVVSEHAVSDSNRSK